jgi:AcrR family transcriptional regulator
MKTTKKTPAAKSATPQRTAIRRAPQQARGHQTIEAILEATEQEIERTGLDHLTTKRIAEAANLSIGGLYEYFPNKEAIVSAMVVRWMNRVMEAVEILHPEHSGQTDLFRYMDDSIEAVRKIYIEQPGIGALIGIINSMASLQPIVLAHDVKIANNMASAFCALLPNLNKDRAIVTARTLAIVGHELLCQAVIRNPANATQINFHLRTILYAVLTQLTLENATTGK